MNPLYRRMFQQPGVSRQPMGILASSPELANVAAQRQPVRMAQGGAVNLQTIMGELQQLQKQGDSVSLRRIASDPKFPDVVKRAASNLADSLRPDSVPLIQVGDVNLGNALSDATNRNPIGQSAGGKERSAAITPVGEAGLVPNSNMGSVSVPPVMSVRGGGEQPPTPQVKTPLDNQVMSGSSMPLSTLNRIRAARDLSALPSETEPDIFVRAARKISPNDGGIAGILAANQAETVQRIKDGLYDETGADVNLGVRVTPPTPGETLADNGNMYGVGDFDLGEALAGTATPTTTPTQDKAATDAGASTDNPFGVNKKPAVNEGDKKPNVSQQKLGKLLQKAEAGTLVTGGDAAKKPAVKLNAAEAATPEAAAALSMVLPAKTSLSDMEKQAKEIMGFDPSRASESKSASFWRNLTMAGLAIAAGESENALTNVAKGLMVGMDSYSKDIKDLNEMEAEERKEYRANLVKTDKDEKIALATMQNNFNYRLADLNQKRDQFESDAAYKQQELGLRQSLANRQLEAGLLKDIATLELQGKTLDETIKQNVITNRQNALKALPDFAQNAAEIGYGTIDDKGKFSWNEKGKAWLEDNSSRIMSSALTVKSTTGQAMAPERFAQEILETEDGRISIASQMMREMPQRYNKDNPPSIQEMYAYTTRSVGGASTTAAPAAAGAQRNPDIEAKAKAAGLSLQFDPADGAYYYTLPNGDFEKFTGE